MTVDASLHFDSNNIEGPFFAICVHPCIRVPVFKFFILAVLQMKVRAKKKKKKKKKNPLLYIITVKIMRNVQCLMCTVFPNSYLN